MEKNLISIINSFIDCSLCFEAGFHSITGIYYPNNVIDIRIYPNTLKGGYLGNTLLVDLLSKKVLAQSCKDIRIGDYIFSKSQLIIPFEGKKLCLKGKYGYLKLKADIQSTL